MTQILAVNEIFGPTLQGEGPSTGRRAVFLRLAMCNLKCTWCDTKFTWDWDNYDRVKETHLMTVASVRAQIEKLDPTGDCILVISGGEPMLQQKVLIALLSSETRAVEIETNGTVPPTLHKWYDWLEYNVSPKLDGSGNPVGKAMNFPALEAYRDAGARFKFVISNGGDFDQAVLVTIATDIPKRQVWVMPEGTYDKDLLSSQDWIAERAIKQGWNFTTRLHVLLWGNTRGR